MRSKVCAALAIATLIGQGGCSTSSAKNLRDGGLVLAAAGGFGLVAAGGFALGGAEKYLWQEALVLGGAVFVAGALLAGAGHVKLRTYEREDAVLAARGAETERVTGRRAEAWRLTQAAATAARANDCPTVIAMSAKVQATDAAVHADVFLRDVAIARCLSAAAAP